MEGFDVSSMESIARQITIAASGLTAAAPLGTESLANLFPADRIDAADPVRRANPNKPINPVNRGQIT
jgi:hypothetical protein